MSGQTARFWIALGRAFGGAVIFALPLLMTMEMWHLGFYMSRASLLLLLVVTLPMLIGLSYYSGFEETFSWKEDTVDAFVAIAVGALTSTAVLLLLGAIGAGDSVDAIMGKVTMQTVPASIGALLAQSQFGKRDEGHDKPQQIGYFGGLFLMAVGALFLAWNVAPTEEIVLIAYRITAWHALGIVLLSLAIVHGFMFAMEFRGQPDIDPGTPFVHLFLRYTVVSYAIAIVLSGYVLWTFGRLQGTGPGAVLLSCVVLAFPASLGAAAARLIL